MIIMIMFQARPPARSRLAQPEPSSKTHPGVVSERGRLSFEREPRGSQGMGVVSNDWFAFVLLSILYTFKPTS